MANEQRPTSDYTVSETPECLANLAEADSLKAQIDALRPLRSDV